jgi:hypothetical protein
MRLRIHRLAAFVLATSGLTATGCNGDSGDTSGTSDGTGDSSGDESTTTGDGDGGDGDGSSGDGDGSGGDGDGSSGDGDGTSGDGDGDGDGTSGDGDGTSGDGTSGDGDGTTGDGDGDGDVQMCLDQCAIDLTACNDACTTTHGTCVAACGNQGCINGCDNDLSACNDACDGSTDSCNLLCLDDGFTPCDATGLGLSYLGCEFYPTVTSQAVDPSFSFAVAVANTAGIEAKIRVWRGNQIVGLATVPPQDLATLALPWVEPLKGGEDLTVAPGWDTVIATEGAYRLESSQPVTVYQYNPLEYELNVGSMASCTTNQDCPGNGERCEMGTCVKFENSFTNDASLLLPVNVWDLDYVVSTRPGLTLGSPNDPGVPGFYTVIASEDNTTVTLNPSATGDGVMAGAGVAADGTGTVTLNKTDVLSVFSQGTSDLSGTLVNADRPVQVIAGHRCVYIPDSKLACDHLEESMYPITALARDYVVTNPLVNVNGTDEVNRHVVRVIATEPDTTVTYEPAQGGNLGTLQNAGDFEEITEADEDIRITSDKKVMVMQYMLGSERTGELFGLPQNNPVQGLGDPAMTLAAPVDQYRNQYLFHAPTNYLTNYVNVIAPTGATVTLDGTAIAGWTSIGAGAYSVARVSLDNSGNGNHDISGTDAFGITVYGYGDYTSYWYPGGSDLNLIPQ